MDKNYVGTRCGSLLVLEQESEKICKKNYVYKYKCKCICDCGEIMTVLLPKREKLFCNKCKQKDKKRKPRVKDPKISSARKIWRATYKCELSFEDFLELSQKNCYYCGQPPSNKTNAFREKYCCKSTVEKGNFLYNGLDRLDSSKDHSVDNVVPCCKRCNFIKGTLSIKDFLMWIKNCYYNFVESSK